MNHRQTVSLWVLVERLEKVSADMDLPPERWALLCYRLMPEWFAEPPQPAKPVQAEPGSEEKILAMQRRAKAGQAVFHPQDLRRNTRDIRPDCVPEPVEDEELGLWG